MYNTQNLENLNNQQEMSRKERILLNNPTELASVVRNQTLIVQNELSVAGEGNDENPPLMVYSGFSRFVFAIINAERKSVTANVRVNEIPGIAAASDYAYRMHMDSLYQPKSAEKTEGGVDTSTPAFTKRITSGTMKGKTPVEVIVGAEDKEKAIDDLRNQYKWLKNNSTNPKYAANNKEQMDAITEAVNLFKDGKLTDDVVSAAKTTATGMMIPICYSGFRPLRSREKRNGKTFIYEIKIDWNVGSAYPVNVEIRNYYATVLEKEDGQLNVQVSTKEAEQKNTMALTVAEWQNILYMAQANMRMFEQRNANACYTAAKKAKLEARKAAGLDAEPERG